MVTGQDIRQVVRELGLSGLPVCIHSSLRSLGRVEGGPSAIIDGFLAEGSTVMVPSYSLSFVVPPPEGVLPERNGWDHDECRRPQSGIGRVFTPSSTEIDQGAMGAIPAAVITMSGRVRGNHPLVSFAAVGPTAEELIAGQTAVNVFAPFEALAEANGSVLLIGVGLASMTLLHLAEERAGRNMFIRWANGPDGQTIAAREGGCSED